MRGAHLLWLGITIVTMVLASLAIWDLGAEAPILAGLMTALVIANCESIVISGNAAGIVDSLCVIAVWCFLRERFVWLGVLSLAMGLLVKPHNTGLIWMCFLLSGGVLRKRALQTLMVTAALGAPCIFWVYHQSPDWPQGLRNNIAVFSEHGGLADPGPACTTANGPGILTNLQAIFSLLRDDPHFYNTATYAACILLFFVWMFVVWRNERTQGTFLVSLAVSSSLSMLPLYHRIYDAKLLLLTIPACTVVWAKNKILRWFALLLNLAALLATADLPQAVLIGEANHLRSTSVVNSRISAAAIDAFPAPLSVALITLFYLGLGLTHSMSLRSRK
ncbi:MAG TPA: hypothetical protein VK720_13725 [Terracidiphilus sp.]|nr:hypothetical protein [Terracidiphilus sp.]